MFSKIQRGLPWRMSFPFCSLFGAVLLVLLVVLLVLVMAMVGWCG